MRRLRLVGMGLAVVGVVAVATPSGADDLYVKSGARGAELALKNVTVRRVKDGKLFFMINQRESERDLEDVSRMELTGETAFNNAERAFAEAGSAEGERAKQLYGQAVTGYQTTLQSTNRPWLKEFVALRMQVAAPKSGRFDAAVNSWVALVQKDPAAAMKAKPALDGVDPKSTYLGQAVKTLQGAVSAAEKPEEKRALLELLGDVQSHMGDTEGAARTIEQRVRLGGNPEEIAAVTVRLAELDVANKRYDAAADRLAKLDLGVLGDGSRAEALYLLAECKAAGIKEGAAPERYKDLAIDYMRVVANFPGSPQAAPALLKVAQIHEALKDAETALKVYRQVVREHAGTPAAQVAQQGIDRLSKSARG